MNKEFEEKVNGMVDLFNELMSCPKSLVSAASTVSEGPIEGKAGIYLFHENNVPIYVGRSNSIKSRLRIHRTGDHMGASFAFRLAAIEAQEKGIDLSDAKTRKAKALHPEFKEVFNKAKTRVGDMHVQWVLIDDSITQALFEMYVHLELKTPYNDFNNH